MPFSQLKKPGELPLELVQGMPAACVGATHHPNRAKATITEDRIGRISFSLSFRRFSTPTS
jgi:hypothetical protein